MGDGPFSVINPPHPAHNTAQLKVTSEMVGQTTTYKCVATNRIKGQEGISESGITFIAGM